MTSAEIKAELAVVMAVKNRSKRRRLLMDLAKRSRRARIAAEISFRQARTVRMSPFVTATVAEPEHILDGRGHD